MNPEKQHYSYFKILQPKFWQGCNSAISHSSSSCQNTAKQALYFKYNASTTQDIKQKAGHKSEHITASREDADFCTNDTVNKETGETHDRAMNLARGLKGRKM